MISEVETPCFFKSNYFTCHSDWDKKTFLSEKYGENKHKNNETKSHRGGFASIQSNSFSIISEKNYGILAISKQNAEKGPNA